MWTFRRILLLIGVLILFVMGYGVYAFFLGNIDGLTPLPPELGPIEAAKGDPEPPPPNLREKMLEQAFGPDSEELKRQIKLLVRDKGIVLSAGEFSIEQVDGRVKLCPFSAALFPKNKDGGFPEINTVKCDFAFLTLDKPVQLPSELANRKVTAIELRGGVGRGVTLRNNRRNQANKDSIEVFISMSPLFYDEHRNLIWTDGLVRMQDFQSRPEPTKIDAVGMDIFLTEDTNPNKPKPPRPAGAPPPKADGLSSVKKLVLRSSVTMHLYVDNDDGFLGNADEARPKPPADDAKPKPTDKSHVFIHTNGPFTYDPNKDHAQFDIPPAPLAGVAPGAAQQLVLVSRRNVGEKFDQLLCHRLQLQFRKKAGVPSPKPANDPTGGNKEIETAVATVRPGHKLLLTMDTQNLEAEGTELHYACAEPGRGPKTELIGSPIRAVKDGHKIVAENLQLTGNDRFGHGQAAFSQGPGNIDLTDKEKANPRKEFPIHIRWKDTLVSKQERDGGKLYDVWTINEDASYIDEDQKQELHANKIQLWLEPSDSAHGGPRASGGPKQRVHKLEAFGKVNAASPEVIINRADHLLFIFRNEVASGAELPTLPEPAPGVPIAAIGAAHTVMRLPHYSQPLALVSAAMQVAEPAEPTAGQAGAGQRVVGQVPPIPVPAPPLGGGIIVGKTPAPPAPGEPKKPAPRNPVILDGDDVVIYVATLGGKKQLEKVDANGKVHVIQAAEKADEKGLDIRGELLTLVHDAPTDLNVLTVYGDNRQKFARLQLNDNTIQGPKVTIDQIKNRADVDGMGAMEMPSKTSLDGERPARPGARMTIYWNKNMTFDGKIAWFFGAVQGYQDDSSIKCESMQAVMDRTVVFKEGSKDGQNAKIEHLVCSGNVAVKDELYDPNRKLEKATRLVCRGLEIDQVAGPARASGTGRFEHLAPSDSDASKAGDPKNTPPPPAKMVMHLTRIDFTGWMFSDIKQKYKNATFRDNVEVFHVPSETFDIVLDRDKLPKDGFYLKCGALNVLSRQVEKKTVQSMIATTQVFFRNQEMFGTADVVEFDEASDMIIFKAEPGNMVKLFQRTPKESKDFTGEVIQYNRKRGTFRVERAGVINSSWLAPLRIPPRVDRTDHLGTKADQMAI